MFSDYTFPTPASPSGIITFIPSSRFDEKGRQLQFVESEIQRQERLAFLKAAKSKTWSSTDSVPSSGRSSPTSSINSVSLSSSPDSPYCDVLDITNSCPEPFLLCSSPLSPSSGLFGAPSPSSSSSGFKRSHRRSASSLHGLGAIPEED